MNNKVIEIRGKNKAPLVEYKFKLEEPRSIEPLANKLFVPMASSHRKHKSYQSGLINANYAPKAC